VDAKNADALRVLVSFPAQTAGPLSVSNEAGRFVKDARVVGSAGALTHDQGELVLSACAAGCQVSYDFALQAAARALADPEVAQLVEGAFIVPPSSFLLGPPGAIGYRLEVKTKPAESFLSGLPTLGAYDSGVSQVSDVDANVTPFATLGTWRKRSLQAHPEVTLAVSPSQFAMSDDELERWLTLTLAPVEKYYGGLRIEHLLVVVDPAASGVHGVTLGHGGASVLLGVGRSLSSAQALAQWVPTHELVHVLFPSITPLHRWLEEGLATYVEPIIRVRAGRISRERFWGDLLEGLPQGLPEASDLGLNRTRTWGRTYWGGALFWLLVDLRVRERSHGARSIDTALRAILQAGGNVAVDWPIERTLRVADEAVGGSEFSDAYRQMAPQPWAPPLQPLFAQLGVQSSGRAVAFDAAAPLANIRDAITAP
jgi:hypothetical protein